jgi:hypothetical protein
MTKPPNPDFEETRAGSRSGEGTESVMRHLMAAARRLQKRKSEAPDSRAAVRDSEGGDAPLDVQLP